MSTDTIVEFAGHVVADQLDLNDPNGDKPYRVSFLALDTPILTSAGWIAADQLSIGDPVLTWDVEKAALAERRIIEYTVESRRLVYLTFEETRDTVAVTELHAIRLPDGRRSAALATPGLVIQTVDLAGEPTTRTVKSATLSDGDVDAARITVEGRSPAIASGLLTCATVPTRWRRLDIMLEIQKAERRAGAARRAAEDDESGDNDRSAA